MSYLQRKKLAFMAIVNRIKGFVRSAVGTFSLNLSDCVDRSSLINLSVLGNIAQSGTPSPDNPVEVEGVGDYENETQKYAIPVTCESNLIDYGNSSKGYLTYQGKILQANPGTMLADMRVTEKIYVEPNTRYTYRNMGNVSETTSERTGFRYKADGTAISAFPNSTGGNITFTTTSNTSYVIMQYRSAYRPFLRKTTDIISSTIYLNRPLYKIGNYADRLVINYDNRTAKRINNIKAVDMSSLNWTYQQNKYMYAHISDGKTKNELNGYAGYSNYYPLSTVNWDLTPDKSMQLPSNLNSTVRNVLIYDSDYTSAEDFIAYLKTLENPTIYYILQEPEEELISLDWNALPNTVKGTTIITANSNVLPTAMSAEYYSTISGGE